MRYLLYKDKEKEMWFIPRSGERYEFYVKSIVSWQNICDVRTIYRTVKKIRNIGKRLVALQVDEADWRLICEKYPWMAHYDNEVQHKLGTLLLRLFALAIREGMTDVEKEIFTQNHLDEEGLKELTVGEPAGTLLVAQHGLCLEGNRLYAVFEWHMADRYKGCSQSVYHEGDDFFKEGGLRHYLSEEAQERLIEMIRKLRELKAMALARENGFLVLELPDEYLAFRPLPKETVLKEVASPWISSWNRRYYQFLIISKTEDSIKQKFCEWKDMISVCDESAVPAVMSLAREAGDLYLLYTMKSILHQQSEDECEYLSQMDGDHHYVAWQEERTVDALEILHSECGVFSMFNRLPRYFCRIRMEGAEYDTIWKPNLPDEIRITVYHHIAVIHLSEEQVRYFWEKTDANPDSKPIMGMPRKK